MRRPEGTVFESHMRKRMMIFFAIVGSSVAAVVSVYILKAMGCTPDSLATDAIVMISGAGRGLGLAWDSLASAEGTLGVMGMQVHGVLSWVFSAIALVAVNLGPGAIGVYVPVPYILYRRVLKGYKLRFGDWLFWPLWWLFCGWVWTSAHYGDPKVSFGNIVFFYPTFWNLWSMYLRASFTVVLLGVVFGVGVLMSLDNSNSRI